MSGEAVVAWRNLEDRGNVWRRGGVDQYPVVHQAVGPGRTRCGREQPPAGGELVPTDRDVTCWRCEPPAPTREESCGT